MGDVSVRLTAAEVEALVRLAHYYERSYGLVRHFVRLTGGREIRLKYRFVADEGAWLEQFSKALRSDMSVSIEHERDVSFTLRSVIAYWGRVIACLDSRRSRRRLSTEELERLQVLGGKLCAAVKPVWLKHRQRVDGELRTRRPREVEQMHRELERA